MNRCAMLRSKYGQLSKFKMPTTQPRFFRVILCVSNLFVFGYSSSNHAHVSSVQNPYSLMIIGGLYYPRLMGWY